MKIEIKQMALVVTDNGKTKPVWMWAIALDGDWIEAYQDEETAREKAATYVTLGDLLATLGASHTTD